MQSSVAPPEGQADDPEPSQRFLDEAARIALVDQLIGCGAVLFGEFTLTSGATSNYYVDIKRAMTDPAVLKAIARAIAPAATDADLVSGMALGAVPLAVAVSLEADLPFTMIRKENRSHGTGRRIEGPAVDGKRVLVVEDVATSGGSTRTAIEVLRQDGAIVDTAFVVVDRESGGAATLAEIGVRLVPLVTATDLLDRARATGVASST